VGFIEPSGKEFAGSKMAFSRGDVSAAALVIGKFGDV
jgi:hypothetical protein